MANLILLYDPIFTSTAVEFITQLNDLNGEDAKIRVNSPGGSVYKGWGMISASVEYEGELDIQVDGSADSMTAVFLLFHEKVEGIQQSRYLLHRASNFFEDNDEIKAEVKEINVNIRKAFEKKLDIAKFEEIASKQHNREITIDEFFNGEKVIDVRLNAKQAKSIGLIKNIKPMEAADFKALDMKFAAMAKADSIDSGNEEEKNTNPIKNKKMDINEFKASHPAIYAEAVALGKSAGIKAEQDRVGSFMEFNDVDPKGVAAGIESGDNLSAKAAAGFMKAQFSKEMIVSTEDDNVDSIETPAVGIPTSEAAKELATAKADLDKELGINQKETK
jgi:ATP-dependent protease ClpP protease subunit